LAIERVACFGARDQGRCDNLLTIRRDEVEARVLTALEEKLLRQDLFEEFCDEFTREMNRLRMAHRATLSAAECEIERIEVRRKRLIEMGMEGVPPSEVRNELTANAAKREELKARLAAACGWLAGRGETGWQLIALRPPVQRSLLIVRSIWRSSTGAPATLMKATITPRLGLFGGMITSCPRMARSKSSTSNATCATVLTRSGYGASAQYRCHWMPNGLL